MQADTPLQQKYSLLVQQIGDAMRTVAPTATTILYGSAVREEEPTMTLYMLEKISSIATGRMLVR